MLLTDVKGYLTSRGRASLTDLATHFTVEPEAMRGLVETWVAKGRARRVHDSLPCGSCGKCESAKTDTYEWLGRRPAGPAEAALRELAIGPAAASRISWLS